MTTWFQMQWPVFLIVCHLLASVAATRLQHEQKKVHKNQKATIRAEDARQFSSPTTPEMLTFSLSETGMRKLAQEAPMVQEERTKQSITEGGVTRKTLHGKKVKKPSSPDESVYVTDAVSFNNKDTGKATMVPNRQRVESIPEQDQRSKWTKPVVTSEGREAAVRTPRVKATTTLKPATTPTSPTSTTRSLHGHYQLITHETYTNKHWKPNRTDSKSGPDRNSSDCNRQCDMSRCRQVEAETCKGRVIKDHCNCCPVCFLEAGANFSNEDSGAKKPPYKQNNACDGMVCTKNKVCILNIQGIPMCRCPNIYSCRNAKKTPLCGQNGITYKNKCFLKVDECTEGRRIRVIKKGSCPVISPMTDTAALQSTIRRASFNSATYPNTKTHEVTKRKDGKVSKSKGNYRREVGERRHKNGRMTA